MRKSKLIRLINGIREAFTCNKVERKYIESDKTLDEVKRYHNIPLYTADEMKKALEDNSDEARINLWRQGINGFAGIYRDNWIVGKRDDGTIVKMHKNIFGSRSEEYIKKIREVESRAFTLADVEDELFCKFTYNKENQDIFSIHVELVNEYKEKTLIEDSGHYGGLHFVKLNDINLCTDCRYTFYGNKVAILRLVPEEVYYEYIESTYVGRKIWVEKLLELSEIETWRYLSEMTSTIRNNKGCFIQYLHSLGEIDGNNYDGCIKYLESV